MQENKNQIYRKIAELNKITGLSLELKEDTLLETETTEYMLNQLHLLISSYKEKNDKISIYKRWLTDNLSKQELEVTSRRFHVEQEAFRTLFLIESFRELDDSVTSILTHAFPEDHTWIIPMNAFQIAMVFTSPKKSSTSHIISLAYLIMDILNTEAMTRVKVAYSSSTEHLNQLPQAFHDTALAMKVCKIFYPEQNIYAHNQLGIGRLVYGLTTEQCTTYLTETIGENYADILQEETAHTFNCFFDHNLNIAETARQLHMHRNTFIYRLEQLEKQTNLDVRRFHDAMTFKTALLVMNYISDKNSTGNNISENSTSKNNVSKKEKERI